MSRVEEQGELPMRPLDALRPGMATACGSLPHVELDDAADLILATLTECPAVPSLPNRHPAEGMLGQAAVGIAGITVQPDGTLTISDPKGPAVDAAEVCDQLPDDAFGSTLTFLDRLASSGRRPAVVKLQCTGPVTFGFALVTAGMPLHRAFPLAAAATRKRAKALVAAAQARLGPDTPLVLVLDEPTVGAASLGHLPVSREEAVDLLSGTLGAVEAQAVAGVHCCAPADWGAVMRAGPALVSFPMEMAHTARAMDLGPFLDAGGWVAWGAVPTDGPLAPLDGGGDRRLWRRLTDRWHALVDGGVDPVLLRQRALVTPGCGLARHDETQAALAMHLTAALGDRIADGSFDAGHQVSG